MRPTIDSEKVQNFKKYSEQGAYHWLNVKPSYTTSFNPYVLARYNVALSQMPRVEASAGKTAVDFGCGDGYVVNQAALRGYSVHGIDGSDKALELGRSLIDASVANRVELSAGNVCKTELSDNSADIVYSLDVIEHLDQPEALLSEMKRVAKSGALAVIGTPVRFTEKPLDKYHVHEFYVEEFRDFLTPHFESVELVVSHPVEFLTLMLRKFRIFGKEKYWGWNFINLYYLLRKKNVFEETNCRFPSYQLAVCRVKK